MCTTNSALPEVNHLPPPPSEANLVASFPYDKISLPPSAGQKKGATLFQKFRAGENIERKNVDLRREREDFMRKLFSDKVERDETLYIAAVKIQKIFRGYRIRPRNYSYLPKRKRRKVYTQNELHDVLCEMAGKLEFKPIPGLTLESRVKASKRKQKIENAAAFIIQRFMKMIFQRTMALIVVKTRKVEQINKSACIITRAIRFLKTKNFVKRAETVKKGRSAIKIQCAYRRWRAYLRMRVIRKKHAEARIQNDAATIIQRNFSSKNREELSLARATLLTVRSCKRMYRIAFDEATNHILNEIVDKEVREFIPRLDNMISACSGKVAETVVVELVESAWMECCSEFISIRLREIEEERRKVEEERRQVEESLLMASEEHQMRIFLVDFEAQQREIELALQRRSNHLINSVIEQILSGFLNGIVEKRVAEYALQRYKEEILHEIEERKRIEIIRKKAFEDFVRDSAESFVHFALNKHIHGITYKEETEKMILEIAQKIADDSINAAVSICSDSYSLYARELASLNDVTVFPSVMESMHIDSIAESELEPENSLELEQPTIGSPDFNNAVESQVAEHLETVQMAGAEVDDMGDETASQSSSTEVSIAPSERRQIVSNHVKDTAELFARARYEDAIGELNPVITELLGMMEHIHSSDVSTGKEIKFKILISVSRLLKARALQALGNYDGCKVELDRVLEDRESSLGESNYLVAEVCLYLGEWYRAIGNYLETENYLKKADDIMMKELALTEKDPDGLCIISSTFFKLLHRVKIAKCELLRNLGQYYKSQESLKQVQKSLSRYKALGLISFEVQEEFHVCYINSIILRGKYSNAITLHKELLEKRRAHYGSRHPKVASSLDYIGRLHLSRSEMEEAANCLEESMAMRYGFFPADHPAIAASHLSKAEAFCALGRFEDAFVEATRSLQLFHGKFDRLNQHHPSIARSLIVLSRIHVSLGEPTLAFQAAEDSLKIYKACWGVTELHRRMIDGLEALAESFMAKKAFADARETFKQVIAKRDTLFQLFGSKGGVPHELSMCKFLFTYCEVQSVLTTNDVIDVMKEHTKSISHVTGNRHAAIARCLFLISEVCKIKGGHADAKSYIGFSYDMIIDLHGEEYPLVPLILAECADNLRIPGFYPEAMDLCDNSLGLAQRVLRIEQNTLLAQIFMVKGQILSDLQRYKEAEDALLHAINMVLSKAGKCAFYGIIVGHLAELYRRRRKIAMAERNFVISLQICQVQSGLQSLAFLEMAMNYALLLMDMKQWFQAMEILQRDVEPQLLTTLGRGHIWTLFVQANAAVCAQIDDILNGQTSLSVLKELTIEGSISEETILSQSLQHSAVQNFLSIWKQAGFGEDHPWYKRFQLVDSFLVVDSDAHSDVPDGQSLGFSIASYSTARKREAVNTNRHTVEDTASAGGSWVTGTLDASDGDNVSLPSYDGSASLSNADRSPRVPGSVVSGNDSQSQSIAPVDSSRYSASAALSAVLSLSKSSMSKDVPSSSNNGDSITNSQTVPHSSVTSSSMSRLPLRNALDDQQSQFSYSAYNSIVHSARSNYSPRSLVSRGGESHDRSAAYTSPGDYASPRSVYTGKSSYVSITPSTVRSRLNNLEDSRTTAQFESSVESSMGYETSLAEGSVITNEEGISGSDGGGKRRIKSLRRGDSFADYLNDSNRSYTGDGASLHSRSDHADDDNRSYDTYESDSLVSARGDEHSIATPHSKSASPRLEDSKFDSPERSPTNDFDLLGSPQANDGHRDEASCPSPPLE
jgi:tetratricopeptide (TPR) repeat protein